MDGAGNKLLPRMGMPRSLRKCEDGNLGRCTTREAIASCTGQVCSAAPASAGRGEGVWARSGGCGPVWEAGGEKFSFPSSKIAEILRIPDFLMAVTMI